MGKPGGAQQKHGKGGGRKRHIPYANDYRSGRGGSYRGGERDDLLHSLLERESARLEEEQHEDMIEKLASRLAPHHSSRGAAEPPS